MAGRRGSLEGNLLPCSAKPHSNVSQDKLARHQDTKPSTIGINNPGIFLLSLERIPRQSRRRWLCKWLAGAFPSRTEGDHPPATGSSALDSEDSCSRHLRVRSDRRHAVVAENTAENVGFRNDAWRQEGFAARRWREVVGSCGRPLPRVTCEGPRSLAGAVGSKEHGENNFARWVKCKTIAKQDAKRSCGVLNWQEWPSVTHPGGFALDDSRGRA